jgi:oxygen-dependent protoporphyrinogen oxidase
MFAEPWIPAGGTAGESLQDYFTRRLGAGFARELLPAVVAGVLAAPPQAIDAEALPRLARWEARGGLLLGSLKEGREHTRVPLGGVGTLARSLASRLGSVHTGRRALALEPLPGGRWRVLGEEGSSEADQVVLALPPQAAAKLLEPLAPDVARSLASLPSLDLRVWHSRHPMVEGWERGIGLLVHPPEARGLLGTVSLATDDPRGVAGLLQLRTYAGGAYPIDPPRQDWSGIFEELRHWLPELPEPTQVHLERCPAAFPLLAPGHRARVAKIVDALPPNLHWLSAARLGPGLPDLAAGVADWALNGPCGMA